jgi:glutamine synthetase
MYRCRDQFEGINQEVACGQWEFQLFAQGAKKSR